MTAKSNENLDMICRMINETVEAEKIYLFGSYANGTPNAESDYDLCVIIPDNTLRPVDAMRKIHRTLYGKQSVPLDVLVYRAEEFALRQQAPTLERKIAREGVLLHERQKLEQRMA